MVPEENMIDYSGFVRPEKDGRNALSLAVEGIHCAGCAFRIEKTLNGCENVEARVNVTQRRLKLVWAGGRERGNELVSSVAALGFKFSPVTEKNTNDDAEKKFLLRCMAVSGFATGNIMIFSVALWFSSRNTMGASTRDLMHWMSALIALPAVVYAGRPFFNSAWKALRHFRTNMDVPISLAIILSSGMSLFETVSHGEYVYFDSAVMLLFLLLCGRYLDAAARGRARTAAGDLLSLMSGTATVLEENVPRRIPAEDIREGMMLLVAAGERIFADGKIETGETDIDTSAITGETMPRRFLCGDSISGGMLNLSQPIRVRVEKAGDRSLMGEIARLMEKAEQGNAAYVRIADKIAGWYTPAVHALAFATFSGWIFAGLDWQPALMNAVTVLIITCPCALGLAVPVVQVLASARLFRRGILLKSADALERLEKIDMVVFDKTGTLTEGRMTLTCDGGISCEDTRLAASLAAHSRHPFAKSLAASWEGEIINIQPKEIPGKGMEADYHGETVRLGSSDFVGTPASADGKTDLWFRSGNKPAARFIFEDKPRADAADTVKKLEKQGCSIVMLSGDRRNVAEEMAKNLHISNVISGIDPKQKMEILDGYIRSGHRVLMVGDGLNDAPSLARASVSMSPSSALEITQNAADIVFQGNLLAPIEYALRIARFSQRLVRQNFALSFFYNIIAVPMAMAGHVTPLVAAISMSSSSLLVVFNALRLSKMEE